MKGPDQRAMERWLEHGPPSDGAKQKVGAKAVIRRLRPRIQAAILDGTTDLAGVHAMMLERGYNVRIGTIRSYLSGAGLAEPRLPGSSHVRKVKDSVHDSWVCQVCESLPEAEVPASVRERHRQILRSQERAARLAVLRGQA